MCRSAWQCQELEEASALIAMLAELRCTREAAASLMRRKLSTLGLGDMAFVLDDPVERICLI